MIQRSNVRRWVLMNGQMQVRIHQGGELRLRPLGLRGADSENDTESREHFQTQRSKQSKRCDQQYDQHYGQSDQNNQIDAINDTTSDTVRAIKATKAIWSAIQSGQTWGWFYCQ